ncbi:MAG: SurA N-terminal domain-containing protein [Solidesulfovibrio sp. DCME]|uniref:SurA N-terminal domain-containing protein n=1 Tax=Solidesulfovibrio sp. DCME TaxID=3447380 RepID=UPI003D13E5CA
MPRLPKICIVLGLLLALAATASAAELVDRVVAVVNGKMITLFDLNSRVADLMQRTQGVTFKADDPRADELRRQILDTMITDLLIESEATRLKITVSETELDNQIDELKKKNNLTQQQLLAELAKEGLTLQEFRKRLRDDSIKKRLLGYMVHRKVLVTDDEVRDYYEKNKDSLSTTRSITGPKVSGNIGFIMVGNAKQAEELRAKINSGAMSFAEAAKKFSIGPGRDQGGDLGDVQAKDLAPPLRDALGAVPAGQVTAPVMLDGKAVLLTLRAPGAAKPAPAPTPAPAAGPALDGVKDQIQETLYKEKFDKLFQAYIDNLRSKAVVEVKL